MSQLPVWLYWEGPAPPYIELCLEILKRHHPEARVLDRAGFDALWVHERGLDIDALALNHKSDFIRAYLLAYHGGLYIDADCILFRRLDLVLAAAEEHGFAGYREPQGYMSCNFMAALPRGAVIADHYRRVVERIRQGPPFRWLDLASTPMDLAVAGAPVPIAQLPTKAVMPLAWNDTVELATIGSDAAHARRFARNCLCYMLANATIKRTPETQRFLGMSREALLGDGSFLGFLFRLAIAAASAGPNREEPGADWTASAAGRKKRPDDRSP
jgi:hypothetical protein